MSKASNIGKVLRMLARLDFLGRGSIRGSTEGRAFGGGEGGGPARSQAGFSLLSVYAMKWIRIRRQIPMVSR